MDMHPALLTFSDIGLEDAFRKRQLETTFFSELFMTGLMCVVSIIHLCLEFRGLSFLVILQSGVFTAGLFTTTKIRREVLEGRFGGHEMQVLVGLYILWLVLFEALLQRTVSAEYVLLRWILVEMGSWIVITWNSSPMAARHYIPFQLCFVLVRFFMRPVEYMKDDALTEGLRSFWRGMCTWNGLWLNGLDTPCPDLTLRGKAQRSHLFLSVVIGFALPGLLNWIWEAKSRQTFCRAFHKKHRETIFRADFVPVSYTVVLTLVSLSLLWIIISSTDSRLLMK